MKNVVCLWISLFFAIPMFGQNVEEIIYTFQDGDIRVNEKFQVLSTVGELEGITPYKEIGTVSMKIESNDYNLKVLNFNGWRGDGGDFRVIRLFNNTDLILEFIDEEAWRKPYSEFYDSVNKFASFNNYSLVYPLQNEVTALLFEGYSWASQVPLLTIVIIKDNKAKVVFNKSLAVSEFNAYSKGFELTLIDDFDNPDKIYKLYTTTEGLMSILEIE